MARPKKNNRAVAETNGNWKGGVSQGYIRKHLPERMIARYDAIVNDPELISVRNLLALTGVRLTELEEKLPKAEHLAAWDALGALMTRLAPLLETVKGKAGEQARILLDQMKQHYQHAVYEHHVWEEIHGVVERARRLAKTEQEREQSLQANLSAAQAIALFNRLFQLLVEEIEDVKLRARLSARLLELVNHEKAQGLLPASTSQGATHE